MIFDDPRAVPFEDMKTRNKTTGSTSGFDAKKLRRLPRGSFLAKRGETQASNTKVRISISVDLDVLNFFKERATQPGALPYQTQMNIVLRREMEDNEEVGASLARDERFIQTVAQRVSELSPKRRKTA